MKRKLFFTGMLLVIGLFAFIFGGQSVQAQKEEPGVMLVSQLIVKYKSYANLEEAAQAQAAEQMQRLSEAVGLELTYFRPMSGEAHVLRLPERISEIEAEKLADRLEKLPEVEYAQPDYLVFAMGETPDAPLVTPNDPQYNNQWHYFAPSSGSYGIDAPAAWDLTTGSASVYVAVLDTGILNHADLSGRWQGGYDMVSDVWMANDGDGRDSNPLDPGDWVAFNDCYLGSSSRSSSWHGTHVAGTIGAATNNGAGVAGINWVSKIIPVRVLGRCGGTTSDIADGIRWAAGLSVSGVPANPYPAKVINMSLGGERTNGCADTPAYQSAVSDAYAAGASVIVSAGNSSKDASTFVPASCNNVVTVAATNRNGYLADYSNYGTTVEISAPGGDTYPITSDGVLSTLNSGTTVPSSDSYVYYQGTSMAAPHVSGIASLLYSMNPSLSPAQVLTYMQSTVTPFPGGSTCNTSICGSGIINAGAAVAALGPSAPVLSPISNADGDGNYTVSWVKGTLLSINSQQAAPEQLAAAYNIYLPLVVKNYDGTVYTLQEDDNAGFTTPTVVYSGTYTSWNATGKAPGTYFYRVMASNSDGDSGWSNVESVTVGGGTSGWTNITTLDFEGVFPGSWTIVDNSSSDGGEFYWGKRNCQVANGSYSGWAVGGGASGGSLACGSNYPDYSESWMIYGPFDLSTAQDADIQFRRWLNTEMDYDWLCLMVSTDGSNFNGNCSSGNSAGWDTPVYDLSGRVGESQVWVAIYFTSDVSNTFVGGAYVDDIVLRKCDSNCTTVVNTPTSNVEATLTEIIIERTLQR